MSDIDAKEFWMKSQMGIKIVNPLATHDRIPPAMPAYVEMIVDTKKINPRFFLFLLYATLCLAASFAIVLGCYMVSQLAYICSFYPAIGFIRFMIFFFEEMMEEGLYNYTYKEKEDESAIR